MQNGHAGNDRHALGGGNMVGAYRQIQLSHRIRKKMTKLKKKVHTTVHGDKKSWVAVGKQSAKTLAEVG